jgi:hypothetical protein
VSGGGSFQSRSDVRCLTKERGSPAPLQREKLELQERIYNQHVRLLSPSPLVVSASKVYSSLGAGIVYGIITLVERF